MKDAYERRALLLHLGDVLEAVRRLMACGDDERTVQNAVAANASLQGLPLLMHVSASMTTRDFVGHATAAFCSWPETLLELELDRERLARTVQQALFADNPVGWRDYAATLHEAVAWFGAGLESTEAGRSDAAAVSGDAAAESEPLTREAPMARPEAGDIERAVGDRSAASRESVENDRRFYPSWPWKSGR